MNWSRAAADAYNLTLICSSYLMDRPLSQSKPNRMRWMTSTLGRDFIQVRFTVVRCKTKCVSTYVYRYFTAVLYQQEQIQPYLLFTFLAVISIAAIQDLSSDELIERDLQTLTGRHPQVQSHERLLTLIPTNRNQT